MDMPLLPNTTNPSQDEEGIYVLAPSGPAGAACKTLVPNDTAASTWRLRVSIVICLAAVAAEVAGGVISGSLALLTDAAHLLSDLAGYGIGLFALWAVSLNTTPGHSFGFHRAEILGALLSILIIWLMTGILIVEAIQRLVSPTRVDGRTMFVVAVFGLLVNLTMLAVLGTHGHSHAGGGGHGHAHAGGSSGHGHTHGCSEEGEQGHAHSHGISHVEGGSNRNDVGKGAKGTEAHGHSHGTDTTGTSSSHSHSHSHSSSHSHSHSHSRSHSQSHDTAPATTMTTNTTSAPIGIPNLTSTSVSYEQARQQGNTNNDNHHNNDHIEPETSIAEPLLGTSVKDSYSGLPHVSLSGVQVATGSPGWQSQLTGGSFSSSPVVTQRFCRPRCERMLSHVRPKGSGLIQTFGSGELQSSDSLVRMFPSKSSEGMQVEEEEQEGGGGEAAKGRSQGGISGEGDGHLRGDIESSGNIESRHHHHHHRDCVPESQCSSEHSHHTLHTPQHVNTQGVVISRTLSFDTPRGLTPGLKAEVGGVRGHEAGGDAEANINVRAAALHVLGDLVQSIGVIIASAIIWWKPEWSIVDPICTFVFAILVLLTTWGLMREIVDVLMERTPRGIDIQGVTLALWNVNGVTGIHCLHVWALTSDRHLASVHVEAKEGFHEQVLIDVKNTLAVFLGPSIHSTVQVTSREGCCD